MHKNTRHHVLRGRTSKRNTQQANLKSIFRQPGVIIAQMKSYILYAKYKNHVSLLQAMFMSLDV